MVEINLGKNTNKDKVKIFTYENIDAVPQNLQKFFTEKGENESAYLTNESGFEIYININDTTNIRTTGSTIVSICKKLKIEKIDVEFEKEIVIKQLVEGILISSYEFNEYKKEPKETDLEINLVADKKFEKEIEKVKTINNRVAYIRSLINRSAHEITCVEMSKIVKKLGVENNLKTRILDEKEMKELGMNLILAVGAGGSTPPRIAVIEYKGDQDNKETHAIVGKGIVYDTGGLNLKPTGFMEDMRIDMTGSAVALATVLTLNDLKVNVNVTAFLALAENSVDANSYKPGDTYKAYNGKYVEITNTDAEGRLVLADAIAFAEDEYKPTSIIDVATLTGAAMVALGEHTAALISDKQEMVDKMLEISKETGEYMWQLPLWKEFSEKMKGTLADLKNSSSDRFGGAMTGAAFIKEFVKDTPWMHIDLAGPAYSSSGFEYYGKGATGYGVRSLVEYYTRGA